MNEVGAPPVAVWSVVPVPEDPALLAWLSRLPASTRVDQQLCMICHTGRDEPPRLRIGY